MDSFIIDRILYKKDYEFTPDVPSTLSLSDSVVCYTDGIDIKIVPLYIMKKYPILYDTFNVSNNKKTISLVVCPFTLASSVFEETLKLSGDVENSSIVLQHNTEKFNAVIGSSNIKRHSVQIKTLRNAFTDHVHAKYLYLKDITNIDKISDIVDKKYYEVQNKINIHQPIFHDKTLVYLILYRSSQSHNIKCTVIVGSNATKKNVSGYNIHESKISEYLEKNEDKIEEKMGFIIPILWFAYKPFYPDAKIVLL